MSFKYLMQEQINFCEKGNIEDILFLINEGYNKNNILMYLCEFGRLDLVKYLVGKSGNNIQYVFENCKATNFRAVLTASRSGHLEIVKYLVEECEVDPRGEDDWAILSACASGHLNIVKYLVEKCGLNARAQGDCAVRWACDCGHLNIVKYLVEKCGSNARYNNDLAVRLTSIHGHLELVKYLVEKCGADARAQNDCAVLYASEYGHFEVAKYLIEKCRAILSESNPDFETYLSVCEKGQSKRNHIMAKRIYFWWIRLCYCPNMLSGHRSMYKGYKEYMLISSLK